MGNLGSKIAQTAQTANLDPNNLLRKVVFQPPGTPVEELIPPKQLFFLNWDVDLGPFPGLEDMPGKP